MLASIISVWLSLFLLVLLGWGTPVGGHMAQIGESGFHQTQQFETLRQSMVEQQIRQRGIRDRAVLQAMATVPRHRFVPPELVHLAYADLPLPIGYDQTISQPYIVAYMSAAARIAPQDKVLEIGTGSGYQAAVLSQLAKEVYSVEIIPELAQRAGQTLEDLGYTNVQVKEGDGYQGWKEHAPYEAILVTAAPDHIPPPLLDQLALGGTMVIPIGKGEQEMVLLTKSQEGFIKRKTIPVRFVPLTGSGFSHF